MKKLIIFLLSTLIVFESNAKDIRMLTGNNWAEKLGYPKGSRVVILHADDIGMCYEANHAAKKISAK